MSAAELDRLVDIARAAIAEGPLAVRQRMGHVLATALQIAKRSAGPIATRASTIAERAGLRLLEAMLADEAAAIAAGPETCRRVLPALASSAHALGCLSVQASSDARALAKRAHACISGMDEHLRRAGWLRHEALERADTLDASSSLDELRSWRAVTDEAAREFAASGIAFEPIAPGLARMADARLRLEQAITDAMAAAGSRGLAMALAYAGRRVDPKLIRDAVRRSEDARRALHDPAVLELPEELLSPARAEILAHCARARWGLGYFGDLVRSGRAGGAS